MRRFLFYGLALVPITAGLGCSAFGDGPKAGFTVAYTLPPTIKHSESALYQQGQTYGALDSMVYGHGQAANGGFAIQGMPQQALVGYAPQQPLMLTAAACGSNALYAQRAITTAPTAGCATLDDVCQLLRDSQVRERQRDDILQAMSKQLGVGPKPMEKLPNPKPAQE